MESEEQTSTNSIWFGGSPLNLILNKQLHPKMNKIISKISLKRRRDFYTKKNRFKITSGFYNRKYFFRFFSSKIRVCWFKVGKHLEKMMDHSNFKKRFNSKQTILNFPFIQPSLLLSLALCVRIFLFLLTSTKFFLLRYWYLYQINFLFQLLVQYIFNISGIIFFFFFYSFIS